MLLWLCRMKEKGKQANRAQWHGGKSKPIAHNDTVVKASQSRTMTVVKACSLFRNGIWNCFVKKTCVMASHYIRHTAYIASLGSTTLISWKHRWLGGRKKSTYVARPYHSGCLKENIYYNIIKRRNEILSRDNITAR
jgi:hypothetical protein